MGGFIESHHELWLRRVWWKDLFTRRTVEDRDCRISKDKIVTLIHGKKVIKASLEPKGLYLQIAREPKAQLWKWFYEGSLVLCFLEVIIKKSAAGLEQSAGKLLYLRQIQSSWWNLWALIQWPSLWGQWALIFFWRLRITNTRSVTSCSMCLWLLTSRLWVEINIKNYNKS